MPGTSARRDARWYWRLLANVVIWVVIFIDAWFLWPVALGGNTSLVLVSGESMVPTYAPGDLVIARDIDPSIGDVVVYAPEELGGSQIVHRIIGGNEVDGWVLQGDNNNFIDPFEPVESEVRGVVLVHYPGLGRFTDWILNPILWGFIILTALVLLLWFSDDCDEEDEEEEEEDGDDELNAAIDAEILDSQFEENPRDLLDEEFSRSET